MNYVPGGPRVNVAQVFRPEVFDVASASNLSSRQRLLFSRRETWFCLAPCHCVREPSNDLAFFIGLATDPCQYPHSLVAQGLENTTILVGRRQVAGSFRAAPEFTPARLKLAGMPDPSFFRRVRLLTLFLAQPRSSELQATPYLPNTHDSLSLASLICPQPPTP